MVLTRSDVEAFISGKDDFIKIDKLNRILRQADSLEVKKYIFLKLAEINESRTFLNDAARNLDSAADISLTYKEKMEIYMKEAELFVKLGQFDHADKAITKAYGHANTKERMELQQKYINFYISNAKKAEEDGKSRIALNIYERLYYTASLQQTDEEKAKMKDKLLDLYNKLGRVRDYSRLSGK